MAMPTSQVVANTCIGGMTNHTWLEIQNPTPSSNYNKMGLNSTAFLDTAADALSILIYLAAALAALEIVKLTFHKK